MRFETRGLNQIQNRLKRMQRNLQAMEGQQEIPTVELLNDGFMAKHTKFPSLQAMADAAEAAGILKSEEDFQKPEWDAFVKEQTNFEDWQQMQQAGATEWARKKLHS